MVMNVFFALFLPLIIIALLIVGLRVPSATVRSHSGARYLRYSLAVLGALLFLYVGFATCKDVNGRYSVPASERGAQESGTTVTVPLVVEPPPSPDSGPAGSSWTRKDITERNIYFYVIVNEVLEGVTRPVHVESFGNLSQYFGRGESSRAFRVGESSISVEIRPLAAWWTVPGQNSGNPILQMHSSVMIAVDAPSSRDMRASYSGFDTTAGLPLCRYAIASRRAYHGSLEPGGRSHYSVWGIAMLAAPDSGEKVMGMEEFASQYRPSPSQRQPFFIGDFNQSPEAHATISVPARGIALAVRKGWGVLAIFAGALLMSQAFRRRQIAFAALMVMSILYIAALDRYAVSVNVAHMKDSAAPITTRLRACQNLQTTFFYKETARKAYADLLLIKQEPQSLKDAVREAYSWL